MRVRIPPPPQIKLMDEEIKKLLEENLKISTETLKILRSIQRKNRLSLIFRFIYWFFIILLLYYSFQFLQPYFQSLKQSLDLFKNINIQ